MTSYFTLQPLPSLQDSGRKNTEVIWKLHLHGSIQSITAGLDPKLQKYLKLAGPSIYHVEDGVSGPIFEWFTTKKLLYIEGKPLHSDLFTPVTIYHRLKQDPQGWQLHGEVKIGKTVFFLQQAVVSPGARWMIYKGFFYKIPPSLDKRDLFTTPKEVSALDASLWISHPTSYQTTADLIIDDACLQQKPAQKQHEPILYLDDYTLTRARLASSHEGIETIYQDKDSSHHSEMKRWASDLQDLNAIWNAQKNIFSWESALKAREAIFLLIDCGWKILGPKHEPIRTLSSITYRHINQSMGGFEVDGEAHLMETYRPNNPSTCGSIPLGPLSHHLKRGLPLIPIPGGEYLLVPTDNKHHIEELSKAIARGPKVFYSYSQASHALSIPTQTLDLSTATWKELQNIHDTQKTFLEPFSPPLPLREYQEKSLLWFIQLHKMGLGGLLADEMGLGKTIQVLSFLYFLSLQNSKKSAPHLIVVPRSLLSQWKKQAERFFEPSKISLFHGPLRKNLLEEATSKQIWITTYQTLHSDADIFGCHPWNIVIFDESHLIRNPKSQGYLAAQKVPSQMKIAMTGTPIFNSLQDLTSQLRLVAPSIVPSDEEPNDLLTGLRPLWLRRTKKQVAAELPDKIEEIIWLDMDDEQTALYHRLLQAQKKLSQDLTPTRFEILEKILRLRQCCLWPSLVDSNFKMCGVKHEQLLQDLQIFLSEERSVLVFSQFAQVLKPLCELAQADGLSCHYIDASVKRRDHIINSFQNGPSSALFMTMGTGSVGLNLTRASAVILLDPWWNESAENQAIDRAHRIGQDRGVSVYRYIVKGTLEEAMLDIKTRKKLHTQVLEFNDPHELTDEENLDELLWKKMFSEE